MSTQNPPTLPAERAQGFAVTLDHVWLAAAVILVALRPLLTVIPPNDFWWHMAVGRTIVDQGSVPQVDLFSFTRAGEAFVNQAWLAQLLMYGLYSLGGLPLVLIAQSLVITLAYGLLLRLLLIRTGRIKLSVAVLLLTTMPLSFDNWSVRPQSYVFPLFAAFLTVLTEHRLRRAGRLWLLPILMVLWVNMHGSFVLGLALIGVTFVGELIRSRSASIAARPQPRWWRAYLLWGALTAAATLLNPLGPGVLVYVRNLLGSNQVTQLVTEWTPPTVRDINGAIFFLFVIALGAALAYAKRRPDLTDMLLAGAFLWLALGATRNIVWFGFVATPLLAVQVSTMLREPPARRIAGSTPLNAALIGVLVLLLLLGSPWLKPALLPPSIGALLMDDTPVAGVRALQQLPQRPARLFHAMSYGSYLIWAAPEQKVFIDPRIELYPFAQWRDYINLGQGNNVAPLLEKYAIDGALLSVREQKPLIERLSADSTWTERYRDEYTVLFTRVP